MSILSKTKLMKINRVSTDETEYLQGMRYLVNMPKRLYVTGSLPKQRWTTVAIVGTRTPTSYGKEVTFKLAYELAKKGVVIVSGLAFGIDAIAHRAALEAGGTTIAVLANGLDSIYPATHRTLAKGIVEKGGALLSEYEPGTTARSFQFLARNRLVSGLADAVIVTEAAARSGTFSTVGHALEQGKDVFAVPGNITSPLSVGPNRLIQQGAHPVLSVDDVLAVIAPELIEQTVMPMGDTPEETRLIELLQSGIHNGDQLQEASGLDASQFSQTMTMLELNGIVRPTGAHQWTLS